MSDIITKIGKVIANALELNEEVLPEQYDNSPNLYLDENRMVRVMALHIDGMASDDLNLTSGRNRVCMLWQEDNSSYAYIVADGGVTFNDPNRWLNVKDIPLNAKWKKVEKTEIQEYPQPGTIGGSQYLPVTIYTAVVSEEDMQNFYMLDGENLTIRKIRYYATGMLKYFIKKCEEKKYI